MSDIPTRQMEQIEARVTDLIIRLTVVGFLVYWSLMLLRPFLPVIVWAVVLAVALAPIHDWLSARLGGRRGLGSVITTTLALLVVIGPVAALATSLFETIQVFVTRAGSGSLSIPSPPEALDSVPFIGDQIKSFWLLASTNIEELFVRYRDVIVPFRTTLIGKLSTISIDLLMFVVAIVVAGVIMVPGPRLADGGRRIVTRLVAPRGEQFVKLAAATIRNVSRGVVGVALVQSIPIGIVLQLAGVPSAGMLAFVVLILCVIQIGPGLVTIPVLIWFWMTMAAGPALLLTIVLVPLTVMDNFLKPMLMGRGLTTPTVVIFLGVVGGVLTYGFIGIFLGPVILAVLYDLVLTWTLFASSPENGSNDSI